MTLNFKKTFTSTCKSMMNEKRQANGIGNHNNNNNNRLKNHNNNNYI